MILKKLDSTLSTLSILFIPLIYILKLLVRNRTNESLIIRPGGMGDLIILCHALKKNNKSLEDYTWIIEKRSELWAKHLKLKYICYDKDPINTFLRNFGKYKEVYNTEQRFGLSQIYSYACCSKNSLLHSFSTNKLSILADRAIEYESVNSHEIVEFSKLFNLNTKLIDYYAVQNNISQNSNYNIFWMSGLNQESRSLSIDKLCEFIRNQHNKEMLFLLSAPADQEYTKKLSERLTDVDIKNEIYFDSFEKYIDKLKDSSHLLSIDSGPVHIASYYSVPTITLFTSGIIAKWSPLTKGSRIYNKSLACSPCTRFGQVPKCNNQYSCKDMDTLNYTHVI